MKENFMPGAEKNERLQVLQDTSISVEKTKMYVPLSREVLDLKREQLTENLIALAEENEAYELVKEEHKAKVKPLLAQNTILIAEVRTGQELKQGTFYHMPNHEESTITIYDEEGNWISERRMKPEEKQGQSRLFIPGGFKTGTED